jgi:hypothetical protein
MPRFSDEVLKEFPIDPKRELYWLDCPWCGGTILWGYRKDRPEARGMAGTTIVHTNLWSATGKRIALLVVDVQGRCEKFANLGPLSTTELVHQLAAAGAKMRKNE